MKQETFNRLPMPTYRYLHVNDTALPFAAPGVSSDAHFSDGTFVARESVSIPETFTGASSAMLEAAAAGKKYRIVIPENTETSLTITIHDKETPDFAGFFSFLLKQNARLSLIWKWEGGPGAGTFDVAADYDLETGARLSASVVQSGLSDKTLILQRHVTLGEDAEADFTTATLGGEAVILNSRGFLTGRRAKLREAALYHAGGTRHLDFFYHIDHIGPETESDIDVKGALSGRAKKYFRGTIDFKRGCAGAVGSEGDYAIQLDPETKNISLPLLLCTEDDVIGNHASSAGQLDASAIYYLMSRGLTKEEARRIVIESLLRPLIDRMDETVREEVLGEIRDNLEQK